MSLLSNANITRYGIVSSWNSNWVESNALYTSIIYADIYINELINGIYYKLKTPNALPIIKNIGYNKTLIYVNSFVFYKDNRFNRWLDYYKDLFYVKLLRRTILFNIKKIYKYKLYYNVTNTYSINLFSILYKIVYKNSLYYIKNKKLKLYKNIIKGSILYNKRLYKSLKKKKKINRINNYKKISKKKYNVKNNKKYNKKYKINNKHINTSINNKILLSNNQIYNNNVKKYKNNIYNNINYINRYYKNSFYRNNMISRKKLSLVLRYKKHKYNINNYKFNNNNNRIKNKINKRYNNKIKLIKKQYNKSKNTIYYLLINKILYIYMYIYIALLYHFVLNNARKKKIKLNICFKHIIINILKINRIKQINTVTTYLFNNTYINRINKINIFKENIKYSRMRSQFRLKKLTEKKNKEKKYYMFRIKKRYHHYFGFVCDTPKYISKVNNELIYKQHCLKMNNTISEYLHYNIYYIHNYNEDYFNRIDNPKLLSDYIKILMKYEEKNPSILKQIVQIHSKQNYKSKVFTRKYIKKTHIFIKKITNKLKIKNNVFYLFYKKKKKTKNIIFHETIKNYKYLKNKKKNNNLYVYKNKNEIKLYNKIKKLNTYKTNNIKKIKLICINNNANIFNQKTKYDNNLYGWLRYMKVLKYKKYPLTGMRIELSGPTKKGRRTQTHLYNEWVDFYTLPGKMQLVKIMNDIKYWQSYGLTQRASIGIKVWMHFHTSRYSELNKYMIE